MKFSKNSIPGLGYGGLKRSSAIYQKATLFEQLPQGQIRPKTKNVSAHQIAIDKTVMLSTENVKRSIAGTSNIWHKAFTGTLFEQG